MLGTNDRGTSFLSRLCGGEWMQVIDTDDITFLSRLCGGE